MGVVQGSPDTVHYLPNLADAHYDTVLVAHAVLQNAPVEAYAHWLRVLKPEGSLCLRCNSFDAIKSTLVHLNALIADIRTLDNHLFVLVKKPMTRATPAFCSPWARKKKPGKPTTKQLSYTAKPRCGTPPTSNPTTANSCSTNG